MSIGGRGMTDGGESGWPEWLPPPVAKHARYLEAAALNAQRTPGSPPVTVVPDPIVSPELCARVYRLTHDARMAHIWSGLTREMDRVACGRKEVVGAWLLGYFHRALGADAKALVLASTPSPTEWRELAERLGRLARELLGLLAVDYPDAFYRFTAWNLLDAGARAARAAPTGVQDQLQDLLAAARGHHWSGSDDAPLWSFGAGAMLGDLPEMLGALANLADWSLVDGPPAAGPNRTASFNTSVYVRDLSGYLTGLRIVPRPKKGRTAGFPRHALVATTATVALNLPCPLQSSFVRRHL